MPLSPRLVPWQSQPQVPVKVNPEHPFAALSPRLLYTGGTSAQGRNGVRHLAQVGNSQHLVGGVGRCTGSLSGTGGGNYTSLGVDADTDIDSFTGVAVFRMLHGGAWCIFNTYMPTNISGGGLAIIAATNSLQINKNDVANLAAASVTLTVGVDYTVAWSWNNTTGAYIFALNGVIVGTGTGTTGTTFLTGRDACISGYYPVSGGAPTGFGLVYMCAIAATPTGDAELVRKMSEKPWEVCAPLPSRWKQIVASISNVVSRYMPWKVQPQTRVGINYANSFVKKGISLAWHGGSPGVELVSGEVTTWAATTPDYSGGMAGQIFGSAGTSQMKLISNGVDLPRSEITVILIQSKHGTANVATQPFGFSPDNVNNRLNAHVPWSDGNVYWDFGDITTFGRISVGGLSFGDNDVFVFTSGAAGMCIYQNGVLKQTGSSMTRGGALANPFYLNSVALSVDPGMSYKLFVILPWQATAKEVKELSENAWQLFY